MESGFQGEGASERGPQIPSGFSGGTSWLSRFRTAGVPLGLGPLRMQLLFVALVTCIVEFFFFFFLQGLSSLLIFLPPSTPRDKD